jgi:hypothetical protein
MSPEFISGSVEGMMAIASNSPLKIDTKPPAVGLA